MIPDSETISGVHYFSICIVIYNIVLKRSVFSGFFPFLSPHFISHFSEYPTLFSVHNSYLFIVFSIDELSLGRNLTSIYQSFKLSDDAKGVFHGFPKCKVFFFVINLESHPCFIKSLLSCPQNNGPFHGFRQVGLFSHLTRSLPSNSKHNLDSIPVCPSFLISQGGKKCMEPKAK